MSDAYYKPPVHTIYTVGILEKVAGMICLCGRDLRPAACTSTSGGGAGNQESLTLESEDAVVGCSGDGMPL